MRRSFKNERDYSKPTPTMLLEVEARARPQRLSSWRPDPTAAPSPSPMGLPVPNAQIGLIAKERGEFGDDLKRIGNPYEVVCIGTDANGRFTIPNVPVAVDWYV